MKNAGFTSKQTRAALATENSRAYLKDVHEYKGVDGRTYKTDMPMPDHEAHLSRRDIAIMKHNEKMSMKEIYRMELFLGSGSRTGKYVTLPSADRDRIAAEYPIRLNPDAHRYEGDMDEVWAVLAAKFPERAANYPKGYKQCQYALKYGETPVTIVQGARAMTRIEKAALACLILYSAFYADAVNWTKEVCLACMFVFTLVLFFAGGKKDD